MVLKLAGWSRPHSWANVPISDGTDQGVALTRLGRGQIAN
jgi:hypothetical protein